MAGELGFVPEGPHIEEVSGIRKAFNEEHDKNGTSKRREERKHEEKRHPKEHMETIARTAESSNEQLSKKGLPYRFRIYEEQGSVIIDLVMLDNAGNITKEVKRNITDEDFDRLIEDISSIEGLFIDKNG
jgi:uncharacterized FlaG/YvyC family protein